MAFDTTIHSGASTYTYDPSKIRGADDLQALREATGPDGAVDSNVLVDIINKYPAAFHLDRNNGLANPHGPYETPPYHGITDDLSAVLLNVMKDTVESESDIRESLTNSAISEAEQNLASAQIASDKGIAAAESKFTADVAQSSTQLVSSTLQAGMTVGSGAKVAQSGLRTASMKGDQAQVRSMKTDRKQVEDDMGQTRKDLADAHAAGDEDLVELHGGLMDDHRAEHSRLTRNIEDKEADISVAGKESSQYVEESRFLNASVQAVGGFVSGSGNVAAAGSNLDSAVVTAQSRMDDAHAQNHATNRDLFNGGAQDLLRAIGELLDGQKQVAQGGIEAQKAMAQNMGA